MHPPGRPPAPGRSARMYMCDEVFVSPTCQAPSPPSSTRPARVYGFSSFRRVSIKWKIRGKLLRHKVASCFCSGCSSSQPAEQKSGAVEWLSSGPAKDPLSSPITCTFHEETRLLSQTQIIQVSRPLGIMATSARKCAEFLCLIGAPTVGPRNTKALCGKAVF
jgi:hypothetical protein